MKKKIHSKVTKEKISRSLKGRKLSKETRKRMSEGKKEHTVNKETRKKISQSLKNHFVSKETREKISKAKRGEKNYSFVHGKSFLLNSHKKYKKEECLFGCENAKRYDLHHEPPVKDILEWEGKLVNLCRSCHVKVHYNILKLPDNVGISWTKKDTERLFKN